MREVEGDVRLAVMLLAVPDSEEFFVGDPRLAEIIRQLTVAAISESFQYQGQQ